MQPTMNVNTAAETLNLQTNVKVSEIEEMISNDYLNPDKRWSTNPSAPFLTRFGARSAVYPRVDNYDAVRVGARSFQGCCKADEIGSDGAKELESVLLGFGSWCNQRATESVVTRRGDSGDILLKKRLVQVMEREGMLL